MNEGKQFGEILDELKADDALADEGKITFMEGWLGMLDHELSTQILHTDVFRRYVRMKVQITGAINEIKTKGEQQ